MKFFSLILSIFSWTAAISQMQIKGHVVNEATGAAIPSASVFISNTSKGTTTNSSGYFELSGVPGGKQELVISCIGYETNVFVFNSSDLPLSLKIQMSLKIKELQGVIVEPSVEETWAKWGTTFLKNFVGTTANSFKCKIRNEKSIHFRFYKKSNRLVAYSDEPLVLENKALGYVVSYQLENFELNFKTNTIFFQGYSLFESMAANGKEKERWKKSRTEAYNGSIMQFMRSVYNNRIEADGFEVRRMVKYKNPGGDIIRHGEFLLNADSLVLRAESGYKEIYFPDYLFITYKNEYEEPGYSPTTSRIRKPNWQRSYVSLVNGEPILIDQAGNYFEAQNFLTTAYWGWSEKLANTLPLDYQPDADKTKTGNKR